MSIRQGLLYIDDLQTTATTGHSFSPGYAPTITADDGYAHPSTAHAVSTGYAPNVGGIGFAAPISITAVTPNIKGSFIADYVELGFEGTTPSTVAAVDEYGELIDGSAIIFSPPVDFALDIPGSIGSFEFGSEFSGKSAAHSAAFSLSYDESFSFTGKTAASHCAFEFAGQITGSTPATNGAFAIDQEGWGEFSVKTTGILGAFAIDQALDFNGKTPPISGALAGYMESYCDFSGKTPTIDGEFEGTFWGQMDFSGRTPEIDGLLMIGEDSTMDFSGPTPPTVTIGGFVIGYELSADITTTSDEIIRYRRGYDNG